MCFPATAVSSSPQPGAFLQEPECPHLLAFIPWRWGNYPSSSPSPSGATAYSQDTAPCQPFPDSLCSPLRPAPTLLEKTHLCQFLVTPFWGVIGNGAMQTIIEGWARELQTLYM